MNFSTGTRSNAGLVKKVLGQERFAAMSAYHIVIAFDRSSDHHGQYVARVRVKREGAAPSTRALYGSATRISDTSAEARSRAIWRVYNDYVRYELNALCNACDAFDSVHFGIRASMTSVTIYLL